MLLIYSCIFVENTQIWHFVVCSIKLLALFIVCAPTCMLKNIISHTPANLSASKSTIFARNNLETFCKSPPKHASPHPAYISSPQHALLLLKKFELLYLRDLKVLQQGQRDEFISAHSMHKYIFFNAYAPLNVCRYRRAFACNQYFVCAFRHF